MLLPRLAAVCRGSRRISSESFRVRGLAGPFGASGLQQQPWPPRPSAGMKVSLGATWDRRRCDTDAGWDTPSDALHSERRPINGYHLLNSRMKGTVRRTALGLSIARSALSCFRHCPNALAAIAICVLFLPDSDTRPNSSRAVAAEDLPQTTQSTSRAATLRHKEKRKRNRSHSR